MAETKRLQGEKARLDLIHLWGDMNLRNSRDNKDVDLLIDHEVRIIQGRKSDEP